MLPNVWVFLYLRSPGLPLWGIYPLDAIRGCVNPISICLAYTADLITPVRSLTTAMGGLNCSIH